MNKDTLLYKTYDLYKQLNNTNKRLSSTVRNSPELINILTEETNFLPNSSSISERLYCYIHDLHEIQRCPYCGKPKLYRGKIDKGYFATCGSDECKSIGIKNGAKNRTHEQRVVAAKKAKETYFKKTGYDNNMKNPEGYVNRACCPPPNECYMWEFDKYFKLYEEEEKSKDKGNLSSSL